MTENQRAVDLSLILRGLFAAAVVWWHTAGYQLELPALGAFNTSGRLAVWMFFGLSGYVIGHGWFSGRYHYTLLGLAEYGWRRAVRILPLFWLITLAAWGLQNIYGRDINISIHDLLALKWFHGDYPVGVFWTLGVELQFYLVAPLLAATMLDRGRTGFIVSALMWLALWGWTGGTIDDRTTLGNIQFFLTGMLVSRAYIYGYLNGRLTRRYAVLYAAIGIAGTMLANTFYHNGGFWRHHGSLAGHIAIMGLLLCHCAVECQRILAGRSTRCLMYLGTLAYGLYAWHGLVLTMWPDMVNNFPATFGLSLALAWISWKSFEEPLLRLKLQFPKTP